MNAITANATQRGGATRAVGLVLILVISVMAGLAIGTLIQQASDDRADATYFWPDEPLNHHTPSVFGAAYFWPDEPLNHHTPSSFERVPADWPDYGLRLRLLSVSETSDTFRLTGPQVRRTRTRADEPVQLRRHPLSLSDALPGPPQVSSRTHGVGTRSPRPPRAGLAGLRHAPHGGSARSQAAPDGRSSIRHVPASRRSERRRRRGPHLRHVPAHRPERRRRAGLPSQPSELRHALTARPAVDDRGAFQRVRAARR